MVITLHVFLMAKKPVEDKSGGETSKQGKGTGSHLTFSIKHAFIHDFIGALM